MNEYGYIYGLIDPRTNRIRYVGSTTSLKSRFIQHLHVFSSDKKSEWVQELKAKNLRPIITILEKIYKKAELIDREKFWIGFYRTGSKDLLNSANPAQHKIYSNQFSKELKREKTLDEVIILILIARLKKHNNNRTQTARSLDVSVRWIQQKIKQYSI